MSLCVFVIEEREDCSWAIVWMFVKAVRSIFGGARGIVISCWSQFGGVRAIVMPSCCLLRGVPCFVLDTACFRVSQLSVLYKGIEANYPVAIVIADMQERN